MSDVKGSDVKGSDAGGADISGLIARVGALEAERAILATLYRYGHTIGVGDDDGWLDCFAADAVFDVRRRVVASESDPGGNFATHPHPDVRGAAKPSVRYDGRDGLRRFITQHPKPPQRCPQAYRGRPGDQRDGLDRDRRQLFLRLDAGPDGAPHVTAFGRYCDRMAEGIDGRSHSSSGSRRWNRAERIRLPDACPVLPKRRYPKIGEGTGGPRQRGMAISSCLHRAA